MGELDTLTVEQAERVQKALADLIEKGYFYCHGKLSELEMKAIYQFSYWHKQLQRGRNETISQEQSMSKMNGPRPLWNVWVCSACGYQAIRLSEEPEPGSVILGLKWLCETCLGELIGLVAARREQGHAGSRPPPQRRRRQTEELRLSLSSESFREWLNTWADYYSRQQKVNNTDRWANGAALAFDAALVEFERKFTIATLEDLAASTGTIWIEERQGDE